MQPICHLIVICHLCLPELMVLCKKTYSFRFAEKIIIYADMLKNECET